MSDTTPTAIIVPNHPDEIAIQCELARDILATRSYNVIVLSMSLGNVEAEDEEIAVIEKRVKQLVTDQGLPLKSLTVRSSSAARAILDTAREQRIDLLVLSAVQHEDGHRIGSVAENVAAAAPCRLVIYRKGATPDIQRIVSAVSLNEFAETPVVLAAQLAERQQRESLLLTVGSSAIGGAARRYLRERIDNLGISSQTSFAHLTARDPIGAIFAQLDEHDLLVLAYHTSKDPDEDWFYQRGASALLRGTDGPVLLIVDPHTRTPNQRSSHLTQTLAWLRPVLTPAEQRELIARADQMAAPSLDYLVLTVISALLASFGLLANSNAVIIGAMLVAPLMAPLVAFAIAGVTGQLVSIGKAAWTLSQGFGIAVLVALLMGVASRSQLVTPEMAARGNPTLLDLGVAFASGTIAAYANARKDIPAALAGVAIAAALMPPICTIGLGLALGDTALFRGAGLLFVVNIAAIVIAAWLTFFYLGVRPRSVAEVRRRPLAAGMVLGFFGLVLALVLNFTLNPIATIRAERLLREEFGGRALVTLEIRRSDPLEMTAIVRRAADQPLRNAEVQQLEESLAAVLQRPVDLRIVVQPVYGE